MLGARDLRPWQQGGTPRSSWRRPNSARTGEPWPARPRANRGPASAAAASTLGFPEPECPRAVYTGHIHTRAGPGPAPLAARETSSHKRPPDSRFIFVTGGVVSALGKGIAAASLGRLLVARGLSVTIQKFDPYINVDPGTMSPFQHGEVFVTEDGAETDLDLGHYERFTDVNTTRASNATAGAIYNSVIRASGAATTSVAPSR